MDTIRIEGLRCRCHVGVPLQERRRRQEILIDLELGLNLRPAGEADQVKKTIDYAAVAREAKILAERGSYRLAEAMAESIARYLLKEFRPSRIQVRIRKFSVPGTKSVGVEMTRRRS